MTVKNTQTKIEIVYERQLCKEWGISRETMRKIRNKGVPGQSHMLPYHILGIGDRQGIVYYRHEINEWLLGLPSYTGASHYIPPKSRRGRPRRTQNYTNSAETHVGCDVYDDKIAC